MQEYNPLSDDVMVLCEDGEPIQVTVDSVTARLSQISASRAGGPENLLKWVLKEFSDSSSLNRGVKLIIPRI